MQPSQPHESFSDHLEQEVSEDIHPLLRKITDNLKTIGIVIGAVVLIAAGYSGFTLYKQRQVASAQSELGQILSMQDPAQAAQALDTFVSKAPTSMQQGVQLELARLAMEAEKYEQASTAWEALIQTTPADAALHTVAQFGQAKALRLSGNTEQALDILQNLRETIAEPYRQFFLTELAATAEAAQNWDTALSAYQELRTSQEPGRQDFLEYKITQIRQHQESAS